jgi:hypothetical protein
VFHASTSLEESNYVSVTVKRAWGRHTEVQNLPFAIIRVTDQCTLSKNKPSSNSTSSLSASRGAIVLCMEYDPGMSHRFSMAVLFD